MNGAGGPVVLHMNMGAVPRRRLRALKHLEEVAPGYAFALAAVAERG